MCVIRILAYKVLLNSRNKTKWIVKVRDYKYASNTPYQRLTFEELHRYYRDENLTYVKSRYPANVCIILRNSAELALDHLSHMINFPQW